MILHWNRRIRVLNTLVIILYIILLLSVIKSSQLNYSIESCYISERGNNGDLEPPIFENSWITPEVPEAGDNVTAWAIIRDESGIAVVYCRVRMLNDENYQFVTTNRTMASTDNVTFSYNIGFVQDGDAYYIQFSATDASSNHNSRLGPHHFFSINFEPTTGVHYVPFLGSSLILGSVIIIVILVIAFYSKNDKGE
ncbi:MAG: hypothetical protein ACFFCF_05875 [Promethearchaeota archaeon]